MAARKSKPTEDQEHEDQTRPMGLPPLAPPRIGHRVVVNTNQGLLPGIIIGTLPVSAGRGHEANIQIFGHRSTSVLPRVRWQPEAVALEDEEIRPNHFAIREMLPVWADDVISEDFGQQELEKEAVEA